MSRNLFSIAIHHVQNVLSHHRNFTHFQKVLISSMAVGVLLCMCRSLWSLAIAITYTVSLYAAVTATNYLVTRQKPFPSHQILVCIEQASRLLNNVKTSIFITPVKITPKFKISDSELSGESECNVDEDVSCCYHLDGSTSNLEAGNSDSESCRQLKYVERTFGEDGADELSPEIDKIIKLIKRDFIASWYKLISEEKSVLHECELLLQHVAHGLHRRIYRTESINVFNTIILMFKEHLHNIKQAQTTFKVQRRRRKSSASTQVQRSQTVYKSVEECFGAKVEFHPAVKTAEAEHVYLKSVIEVLMIHLVRDDLQESKALFCALKELLMFNVFQNVINLLSDSTFLHERIIKIMSDEEIAGIAEFVIHTDDEVTVAGKEAIDQQLKDETSCKKQTEIDDIKQSTSTGECGAMLTNTQTKYMEKVDSKTGISESSDSRSDVKGIHADEGECSETRSSPFKWQEDTEVHAVTKTLCVECNRLCSRDQDRISPRPHSCSLGTTPMFFDPNIKDPDRLSLNSMLSLSSSSVEGEEFKSPKLSTEGKHSQIEGEGEDLSLNVCQSSHDKVFNDQEMCDGNVPSSLEKSNSAECIHADKIQSNVFQFPTIQFPNPMNSFPFRRNKTTTTGIPEKKLLSPNVEVAGKLEQDLKRSHSSGEISPRMYDGVPWTSEVTPRFLNIRMVSTETAKEPGSMGTSYTLYVLEYETLYTEEDGSAVQKTGAVKRRHREFINLQSRLEDNSTYKKSMRDIKGPKKMLPSLPFGNMGKDTVDSRKELLENFLTSLLKKVDICNGEEMKQFLGYSGDGHIAFVRKVPDNPAPRIDQRLVKTMSGVFDKIVEGLPSLPQSKLPRIISPFDHSEQKLDEEDNHLRDLQEDTDAICLVYNFNQDQEMLTECGFERFIDLTSFEIMSEGPANDTTLGTSILTWQDQLNQGANTSHMTSSAGHTTSPTGHMTSSHVIMQSNQESTSQTNVPGKCDGVCHGVGFHDSPFSNVVLDIVTELLQGHDHWVCRDNVIHTAKVCMGSALNRFIETRLCSLVEKEMSVFYLRTLQDTVWPGGQLSEEPRPQYTDLQKDTIKKQATRCLADFLPGILQTLLGTEDFNHAVTELIDSLQYEKLNRQFWYTVLDVLVEYLFPEVNTAELQRKLSNLD